MAILTDGVGCGSPGGKWPCYPAVFCIPMLCSVFLCCVLYSYVVFYIPMLRYFFICCVLCSYIVFCVLYSYAVLCVLRSPLCAELWGQLFPTMVCGCVWMGCGELCAELRICRERGGDEQTK